MNAAVKVVVTGARGFVGRALMEFLHRDPAYEPISCVRPGTEVAGELSYDLLGAEAVPDLRGVDVVVHAAARVHVMEQTTVDPLRAFRAANTQGTLRLARAAAEAGVRRFVYLSSIAVNGNVTAIDKPFSAQDTPAPHDAYGVSKFEAEQALGTLSAATGMEIVIVRPPLVYGPGAPGNVAQMLRWVRLGVPLPLAGIDNRRSLVSLFNLVHFLESCISHPNAAGQVFLVADNESVSTSALLTALAAALGRSPRLYKVPASALRSLAAMTGKRGWFDRLFGSLVVDTRKNAQVLGWSPPQSFIDGIELTVNPPARNAGK